MLQTLVVGGAKEHLGVQLAASKAIVKDLIATEMVIISLQEFGDLLHVDSIIKGRGISYLTLVGRDLHRKGSVMVIGDRPHPPCPEGTQSSDQLSYEKEWRED